jgi:hypothetical protein
MDWYNNSLYYSDMKGDVYVRPLKGMDVLKNHHIPNISGAGALAFEWLGHFLYWAGKTYVVSQRLASWGVPKQYLPASVTCLTFSQFISFFFVCFALAVWGLNSEPHTF